MKQMSEKVFFFISVCGMAFSLASCGALPSLLTTAEDIIDDEAIQIIVSREALGRQTNVKAFIELDNGQMLQSSK